MPREKEVWELKTVDLRLFGWMCKPKHFIGVLGDYADLYKGKSAKKSYEDAIAKVVSARDSLDLDEPKFAKGTFDELVRV
jgi:hypothetical protein